MRSPAAFLVVIGWYCWATAQPTEFFTCLDDSNFCAESPLDTLDLGPEWACGETFYQFTGRLATPVLRNVGPVTISVKSFGLSRGLSRFPLYVEIRDRPPSVPGGCITEAAGALVMIAQGIPIQCGGVWESVGPIDLTRLGVPLNSLYHVQVIGFQWFNNPESPGLACIRVTAGNQETATLTRTWSLVKALYR